MVLYQVINIGSSPIETIEDLGVNDDRVVIVNESTKDRNLPVVYLYWGHSEEDKVYDGDLNLLHLCEDNMIVPIVEDPRMFNEFIPSELAKINALIVKPNDYRKVGVWILRYFGLYESTNKIFISYRRSDTTTLAHQLYERLIEEKYTPFLDCYSIESGVDFQEYLRNEIADADVFVYLNSPNYDDSQYTVEELDCAQKLSLGIVQVLFNHVVKKNVLNSVDIDTHEDAEKDKQYPNDLIDGIVRNIEVQRAIMYEYRRKALVNSYRFLNEGDAIYIHTDGIIHNTTKHELLNAVVHVPNSLDFHKTDKILHWADADKYKKCLLYNSQFVRRDILDHINWLNSSLPIESIDINK